MSDYEQDLAISKALNRARDVATMRALITRRKPARAALEFERAMEQYEKANPVPVLVNRFPIVIR